MRKYLFLNYIKDSRKIRTYPDCERMIYYATGSYMFDFIDRDMYIYLKRKVLYNTYMNGVDIAYILDYFNENDLIRR